MKYGYINAIAAAALMNFYSGMILSSILIHRPANHQNGIAVTHQNRLSTTPIVQISKAHLRDNERTCETIEAMIAGIEKLKKV